VEQVRVPERDVMERGAESAGSICLDACELHHLAPLLGFLGDQLAEVRGEPASTVPPRSASRVFMLGSKTRVDQRLIGADRRSSHWAASEDDAFTLGAATWRP